MRLSMRQTSTCFHIILLTSGLWDLFDFLVWADFGEESAYGEITEKCHYHEFHRLRFNHETPHKTQTHTHARTFAGENTNFPRFPSCSPLYENIAQSKWIGARESHPTYGRLLCWLRWYSRTKDDNKMNRSVLWGVLQAGQMREANIRLLSNHSLLFSLFLRLYVCVCVYCCSLLFSLFLSLSQFGLYVCNIFAFTVHQFNVRISFYEIPPVSSLYEIPKITLLMKVSLDLGYGHRHFYWFDW